VLRAHPIGKSRNTATQWAIRALIAEAGSSTPNKITAGNIQEIDDSLYRSKYAHGTKDQQARALRRVLRWLWETQGAKKLDGEIRHYWAPRPRNVTIGRSDIDRLLAGAKPHLRLWLLLCSDLALRSGTANAISPANYNADRQEISFTTKYRATGTLPITQEIATLLNQCDHRSHIAYVRQLWLKSRRQIASGTTSRAGGTDENAPRHQQTMLGKEFRALVKELGLPKNIRPHDLRRTTAVALLELTGDIRDVRDLLTHSRLQSTLWYLDHNIRPVPRHNLELIKGGKPAPTKEKSA
jgi:integrase